MTEPTIALDLSILEGEHPTGVERHAREISLRLPSLAPEYRFVGLSRNSLDDDLIAAGILPRLGGGGWPGVLWRRIVLPRAVASAEASLLHSFVTHAPNCRGAVVSRCIHGLPMADSARHDEAPSWFRDTLLVRELKRPRPSVFVSEACRADFRRLIPDFPAPTRVIANGVHDRFFAEPRESAPAGPYVLVIGRVRPRRRPELVRSVADAVAADLSDFRILWAGPGNEVDRRGALHFLGYLGDDALRAAMAGASALIAPSRIEGFGIPILEAMAAGTPVLAADGPAVREVGREHARYFETRAELETLIRESLAATPEASKIEAAREHARVYSWEESARRHVEFFRELLGAVG